MKMKRKWTTSTRFMLIILYFDLIKETITVPCPASLHTANDVQRCPRNELEWNAHAARLNCSSINQTCVNPSIFEYHCVLNKEGNGLLEVCAPSTHIFEQKCTEFNSLGKLIQASVINCSDALVTCPNAYRSTEMYKYQACYDVVYQSTRNEEAHCSSRSTEGKSHLGIAVGLSRRWDVYIW
uniref:Uncharacterized protein LOC111103664 isoform X1 n=1 Tax=Crassostrea virginica TaxID=6565 RepID=A0A8B8AP36_CRAVI|nr:uncharacterized protein LOC111103664 isoform X1 [Crassostrea virginica]